MGRVFDIQVSKNQRKEKQKKEDDQIARETEGLDLSRKTYKVNRKVLIISYISLLLSIIAIIIALL